MDRSTLSIATNTARTARILLTAVVTAGLLLPAGSGSVAAAPPIDFEDTLVADVSAPMEVAWTPDGRMLIIAKSGELWVYQGGALLATPALDLSGSLCTNGERGLAGLAVHPNFAANQFVYLYYTFPKSGTCNESEVDGPVNRLSRFVLPVSNVISPSSESVLFETPPMYRDHHTGGNVEFGKDGHLYIQVGDSGAQSLGWPQDLGRLAGKLIRITDVGGIPAGNPYTGTGTARCNVAGVPPSGSPAGTKCQEIYSYGFRNPFRGGHDPNAAGVRFYINDVGQHTWEEISEGPVAGGNYGWQLREGPCAKDSDVDCGSVPGMINPVHWYHHVGDFGGAATAGAFVPNGIWPAAYDGKYLFADYVFGKIYRLDPAGPPCLSCSPPTSGFAMTEFGDIAQVVSMRFGPDNSLYYVSRDGSEVRKITYIGGGNHAPAARIVADPTSGALPLEVQFDGTTSTDADGDTLSYSWDFDGNGTEDSTAAAPTHTYGVAGTFQAALTVNDGNGGTNTAHVAIHPGNNAPTPVIGSPTAGATFAVGDVITLQGSANDAEQGALGDSALSWEVIRHHATHHHPFLEPTVGNGLTITGPEPEDLDAAQDSYLEVRLTATDAGGASTTVSMDLMPKKVTLTFQTSPTGLSITAGGTSVTGPTAVQSWQGYQIPVNAPDQASGGSGWAFASWSDGGARTHTITTPASPATYTATFTEVDSQPVTFNPVADSYVESARPTRNNGAAIEFRTDTSPILNSYLRFNVQGATDFSSVKLRLFFKNSNSIGIQVRPVASTTWGEATITYNNAPAFGAVVANSGPGSAGTWVTINLSSVVTGNGLVSLAVTSTSGTALSIASRESAQAPQLIVGQIPSSSPFVVTQAGSGYQAISSANGTTFTGTLKSVVESAAADLAVTGGGTVTFMTGLFDLGGDHFEFHNISNITFEGQGMTATTLRNNSSAATDTEPFDMVGASFVTVRDMTVEAGGPFRSTSDGLDFDNGSNTLVERVRVTVSRGRGIIFDGKGSGWAAENNVVRGCVITGIPSDGIELLASSGNVVENCTITDVGGHGIQLTKSSTSAAQPNKPSSDNIVRNNTVINAGQDGINVNAGDRNVITGNAVTNSSDDTANRDGIRVGTSDSIACNDTLVDGNLSTDNQATKTQGWGLNIASSLCNRTVVGGANDFAGNRLGPIRDLGTNTIYPPPPTDTQPPTAPTNLQATAVGPDQVNLSWNAATDNVAVTDYDIYRDTVLVGSTNGSTLTFADTGLEPETTYSYQVRARDAADLVSPPSNTASATTTSAPSSGTFTFTPVADSYVHSTSPTTNFGTNAALRFDGSPVINSYLRFDVTGLGGTISGVTLRLFANTSNSTGCQVRPVANTTWSETAITWSNAPAMGPVAAACGPLVAGAWRDIDLTASGLVTGNGLLSLGLDSTSGTATSLSSRQGAQPPQLIVETGGEPPPPPPPGDEEPPSQPTGLQAIPASGCRVDLSWNASTDNVGVTGYRIYRNGGALTSVGGSTLTFQDTSVSPGTSYSYTVDAIDAETNVSPLSAPAPATTPATACTATLVAVADTWVDASQPTINNGTKTQLRVDGSPSLVSYLRFNVQGVAAGSTARLRIFVSSNHSVGFNVHGVSDTTWSETAMVYSNAPAIGPSAASSGSLPAGTWVEVDITSLVTGNGLRSLALTTTSGTAMSLASRESGANAPQLIIGN